MQDFLREAHAFGRQFLGRGVVANYIPELAKMDGGLLGVAITDIHGKTEGFGDFQQQFTIQSITKIILLITAIESSGFDAVFECVGMEPTGDKFNSIVKLETTERKPLNPLINAGAIAVSTFIRGETLHDRVDLVMKRAAVLLGTPNIFYDRAVYASEKLTGNRNRALAYMMRANDVFSGNVEEHLDVYFKACSISATCAQVSYLAAVLAANGKDPLSGKQLVSAEIIQAVRALMLTCGMYDASGEFALKVGLPSKSGVGGGILSVAPGKMGIAVFGPALDEKGNSVGGYKILQHLSKALELNIF